MPTKPVADPSAHVPLSEHLQGVTETLAAARTQAEVFDVVLQPALAALGAVAGVVLLVGETGNRLEVAGTRGNEEGAQTLWQDGPLDGDAPAGDALRRREPLFFEHEGNLKRAYPELEACNGGVAAVGTAILPMFLDEAPLGVIILDFREPHQFTPEEQRFLRTLASQCALALGRVQLLESVRQKTRQKTDILESISDAFYAVDHGWRFTYVNRVAEQWWGRRCEELLGRVYWEEFPQAEGSAPYHAHLRAMRERRVVRLESVSPIVGRWVDINIYPTEDGVSVYFKDITGRKRQEEELRELNTELERRVEERTRGIEEDAQAQEAFVAFTEAVGTETDLLALARQAILVLRARFPGGSIGYYTRDGEVWKAQAWSEDMSGALLDSLRAGLPDSTPLIHRVLRAGTAVFTDAWDPEREQIEHSEDYGTAAAYPLVVGGEVRHLLLFGLKDTRRWRGRDRALVRAVGRGLNLALERAEQTRHLEEERSALAAFVSFTEVVGTQTDVLALARQAIQVLRARFSDASVGYYEPEGEVWKARVWSEDVRADVAALMQAGVPADTPMFREVLRAGQAVFTDAWDPAREELEPTEQYGTVANAPLVVGGEVRGVLSAGLKDTRQWSEPDKALFRAVARGLTLALERAEGTRQLQLQNEEVERRNRALSAFAELTRDLSLHSDPYLLIRRAQEVVLSLLPPGYAVYFELEEGRWFIRSQVGDIRGPGLQAAADLGFPFDTTRNLTTPWLTRQPYYQDAYDPDSDHLREVVHEVGTTAVLPVLVSGEPVGVFGTVLFDRRGWNPTERGVLETVVRSLGLALEGARGVAQLAEEQRKLSAANEELEAFTYSVSHDLRTPVRHVTSFNHLLRKQLGEGVDAKASRYLTVVEQAAGRMNTLIDAMLDLSRTARLPLRVGPVDLGELVGAVRSELEADVHERVVEWGVAPLPLVSADPDTLRQVVSNLLDNALKYTRTREVARIEVWAEERLHEWAVFVRDNGVGFDPHYAGKLFGVFQRLHRHEDFEGTGVGLANVRRIIARHGGRVWAEGRPGEGAMFGFTLPKP